MFKSVLKVLLKFQGNIISMIISNNIAFRLFNYVYERSPYFFIQFTVKYISLPDKNAYWYILLRNGKSIRTRIITDNALTRQFALSYKWHSPSINMTEYLLNTYFDRSIPWIDIGTNLGIRSLLSLSEGRPVYFVEPNKELNEINRSRCVLNNFTNLYFYELGISDSIGEKSFFIDESSYNSTLDKSLLLPNQIAKSVTISTSTVDSVFLDLFENITTACIKIDVEGHEISVLKGAEFFIEKYSPTLIVEVNTDSGNFAEFQSIMNKYCYVLYEIKMFGRESYFRRLDLSDLLISDSIKSNDFLATKDIELMKVINGYLYTY